MISEEHRQAAWVVGLEDSHDEILGKGWYSGQHS